MSYRKYTEKEKEAYRAGKAATLAANAPRRRAAPKARAAPRTTRRAPRRTYSTSSTDGALGEMVGGGIGAAIGGGPGALIGGAIGKGAHKMFKALTGFGDYSVQENTLLTGGMSPPQIINSHASGGFIVRHREYIKDIDAATAFTLEAFPLNPGVASTFPWLSQIATSFEQYRLRGAVFEFKSLSSDAVLSSATSSALGAIIMATDYNVLGATFPDKMQMENYQFANSSKPSCGFLHPIECKKSLTPVSELYIRDGPVPTGADARLYDLGLFQIAAVGMQAASGVAGELWITYEVELFKPKINPNEILADHFIFVGTVSGTAILGNVTDNALQSGSTLGGSLGVASNTYSFPGGLAKDSRWLITYNNEGNTDVTVTYPTITAVGCTIENFFNGGGVSVCKSPEAGEIVANVSMQFVVVLDANTLALNDANVSFAGVNAADLPDGTFVRDLTITQIPLLLA